MKLKNKKTGEIGNLKSYNGDKRVSVWIDYESEPDYIYNSLAELNEEWQDYEEPENFYIVEQRGTVGSRFRTGDEYEKMFKEIGNYFLSREEAEKAVEKLKAWKRLKDRGFRFCGGDDACISYEADIENWSMQDLQDFDLLFGGEE